jgi:ATP-dependent protease ClpP protease subunit
MTYTSSFGVGGFYTPPPRTTAAARSGRSVDDYLAAAKQQHRRAVTAGLIDPGPPLELAITGEITAEKSRWIKRRLARNVFADVSLTFNSRGGLAREGLALYRAIRCRLGRTTGHVADGGICHSAALDIYVACDVRTADVGAAFLLHRTGLSIDKSVRWTAANLPQVLAEFEKMDELMFRMMASRTGAKLHNLMAQAVTERPMTATAAWQLGIVNRQPLWRS